MVLFSLRLLTTILPIFNSTPSISVPWSQLATTTFKLAVDASPYGSQLDMMLNQAYKLGITVRPMIITTATTFVASLFASEVKIRIMFLILFVLLFICIFIVRADLLDHCLLELLLTLLDLGTDSLFFSLYLLLAFVNAVINII